MVIFSDGAAMAIKPKRATKRNNWRIVIRSLWLKIRRV
jgi:hypothetical protein